MPYKILGKNIGEKHASAQKTAHHGTLGDFTKAFHGGNQWDLTKTDPKSRQPHPLNQ
jgi:hypothetical protein